MSRSTPLTAVIFDCDGVLVDSEVLSASVLMEMMAEAGLPITPEIFRSDFLGRSFPNAAQRAEQRFGKPLPSDFPMQYRTRLLARMQRDLRPMQGVFAVIENMLAPFGLATSSSPQRLALSLSVTGLDSFFTGRCTTASEVTRGKPEPDLFLYTARKLNFRPAECLVIEDSEMGIRAAQAAGMAVWHFAGGSHVKGGDVLPPDLKPDLVVPDMAALQAELAAAGLCRAANAS